MAKFQKVYATDFIGRRHIVIPCPGCGHSQSILLSKRHYDISTDASTRGQISPEFVCMYYDENAGSYCQFSGPIWVQNY